MKDTTTLGQPGSCPCGSPTCTGRCPECNMHETRKHGHNVHYGPTAEEIDRELVSSEEVWRPCKAAQYGDRALCLCDSCVEYTADRLSEDGC